MSIRRLACPTCQATDLERNANGNMICANCGETFASSQQDVACRTCGTMNPPTNQECSHCGTTLGRRCPDCNHINGPGADVCENCGNPIDMVSKYVARRRETDFGGLDRRADRIAKTRAEDDHFMAQQRARMEEEERERQRKIAKQREQTRQQQMQVMTWIFGGILLLFVLTVALFLILR